MAEYAVPKRGVEYIFYVSLVKQSDTKLLQANPTLAAGDVKISKDGGAFANLGTLPAVTPAGGVAVKVTVSAAEMTADNAFVTFIDAAGAEWCDASFNIQPATRALEDLAFPATSGRSLDVDVDGAAEANVTKWLGTVVATPGTAGVPSVDAIRWATQAVPTPNQTGRPLVDVTHLLGTAWLAPAVAGTPDVNMKQISGDATAADNMESEYDGTGYGQVLVRTTIAALTSQTVFTITDGSGDNDAYNGCEIVIQDATTAAQKAVGWVLDYVGATKEVTLRFDPAVFTMANTDFVTILASKSLKSFLKDREAVGVNATSQVGIDWGNVGNKTTANDLSGTIIASVTGAVGSVAGAVGSVTGNVGGNVVGSVGSVLAEVTANVTKISGDATAADNAESFFDGTGYAGTNNVIPSVTTVTGNVNGSVGSVTGAVGSVTGSVGSLAAQAKADVNAEVVDGLNVDTYAEIGQEAPAATTTMRKMLGFLYKTWRNRKQQNATTRSLFADDGTTVDQKATDSDDSVTFTKGEMGTGP